MVLPYGADDAYKGYKMDSNQKALEKLLKKAKEYHEATTQQQKPQEPEPAVVTTTPEPKGGAETIALLKRVVEKDRALAELELKLTIKEKELAVREKAVAEDREKLDRKLAESRAELEKLEQQAQSHSKLKNELEEWNSRREQVYGQLLKMEEELNERERRIQQMEQRASENERDLLRGLEMLQGLEAREGQLRQKEEELLRWEEGKRIEQGMLSKREEQLKIRDEEIGYREKELAKERAEVHKYMDEAARVKKDLEDARKELDDLKAENARLASAAKDVESRRLESERRVTELQGDLEGERGAIAKAEVSLAEERKRADALRSEMEAAKRMVAELEASTVPKSRLDEKDADIAVLREELEQAHKAREAVERERVGRDVLDKREKEVSSVRAELESSRAELRAKAAELEPLNKERAELDEQVKRYRKLLDSMQKGLQKASGLDKALHGLQKENELLRGRNKELMEKMGAADTLEAEVKRLEGEGKESKHKANALEAELKLLKESSRGLSSKADEVKELKSELKKRDEELGRALFSLGETKKVVEDLERKAGETSLLRGEAERAKDLERKVKDLERELERARGRGVEVDALREKHEALRNEMDRLAAEAARTGEVRSVLASVEAERDRLRMDLDLARRDGDELRRAREANAAIDGELHRTKAELAQALREAEWAKGIQSLLQDKERELYDAKRAVDNARSVAEERERLAAEIERVEKENLALRNELRDKVAKVEESSKSLVADMMIRDKRISELEAELSKERETEKEEAEHYAEMLLRKQAELESVKGTHLPQRRPPAPEELPAYEEPKIPDYQPVRSIPKYQALHDTEFVKIKSEARPTMLPTIKLPEPPKRAPEPVPEEIAEPPRRRGKEGVTLAEALGKASSMLRMGRTGQAKRLLDELASINPNHPKILQLRAVVHTRLGDYHDAHEDLKAALDADGESATLLMSMGFCALKMKEYSEALRRFEGAYRVGAPAQEALEGVAEAMFALGRYEDAAETARKLRGHDAMILAARAYHKIGREIEAEDYYKKAADSAPDRADGLIGMAQLLLGRKDPEEAVAWAKRAVAADRSSMEAKKVFDQCMDELRKQRGGKARWVAD